MTRSPHSPRSHQQKISPELCVAEWTNDVAPQIGSGRFELGGAVCLFACLLVRSFVCLLVCLIVCLWANWFVSLVCFLAWLFASLYSYLIRVLAWLTDWLIVCLFVNFFVCFFASLFFCCCRCRRRRNGKVHSLFTSSPQFKSGSCTEKKKKARKTSTS